MPLADWTQKHLDTFLSDIAPILEAYQEESFSYLAIKCGDRFSVVQGNLFLNSKRLDIPHDSFESDNVRAGHFLLSDIGVSLSDFIKQITDGLIPTPHGNMAFLPNHDSKAYGARYFPFHEVGGTQRRVAVLQILGGDNSEYFGGRQPYLDWEVRASPKPYDGIQELVAVFEPGVYRAGNRIDITAVEVVGMDSNCTIDGEQAKFVVRAALKAAPEKVRVGYRVVAQGKTIQRGLLSSTDFAWSESDDARVGTAYLSVPKSSVIQAMASYNGLGQNHYYFADPESFLNPLRATYEAADAKLATLTEIIAKAQGPKPDARDFEAAIAGLFWMLGFSPVNVGGPPRMRDAVDILLSTPSAKIAVVECTVGLLKDDSKLPKLHDRTEAVRRNLDSPSTRHIKILPVIVTSKSLAEIKPDLEQAEKLGIYVISREGIERLVQRTLFPPTADQLYEQAEQAVREALAKY